LLAFVAAERREFDGLLRKAERVMKLDWPLDFARMAWLKGEPMVLVANGPGPKLAGLATEIARKHQELKGLVSIGFCGALSPALEPCDIFVAKEVMGVAHALSVPRWPGASSRAVLIAGTRPPVLDARRQHSCERVKSGKLLSVDRVVSTAAEKADLRQTGADAVEMEAAAVALKAAESNIPFYCIRVVTDTSAETFPLDFNRMRDADGRFSRTRIMAAALRRPGSVLPELLKLNKRCKDASQALGDFLVDASF
jgi:adenosylhomocysteine nucleosidase